MLFFATGLVLCAVNGWLFLTSANPLNEPEWGWGAVAAGIIAGAAGIMWSGLHLLRGDDDRAFGILALGTNVAAVMIAFVCLL